MEMLELDATRHHKERKIRKESTENIQYRKLMKAIKAHQQLMKLQAFAKGFGTSQLPSDEQVPTAQWQSARPSAAF